MSVHDFRKFAKEQIEDAVAEINHLAYRLSEEGPRPSFVGSFIKPKLTHVLHRGSPENPWTLLCLERLKFFRVIWA